MTHKLMDSGSELAMNYLRLPQPLSLDALRVNQVTQTLKLARSVIERYGWMTGHWGDIQHGFCAGGALKFAMVHGDGPIAWEAAMRLMNAIPADVLPQLQHSASFTHPMDAITKYNDRSVLSKTQCLAWFDRAIAA